MYVILSIVLGFLAAFAGVPAAHRTDGGIDIDTARGRISVLYPDAFQAHWGFAADGAHAGARLAAFRIGVADMDAARNAVEDSGVAATLERHRVVVAPAHLFGAGLVLSTRSAS